MASMARDSGDLLSPKTVQLQKTHEEQQLGGNDSSESTPDDMHLLLPINVHQHKLNEKQQRDQIFPASESSNPEDVDGKRSPQLPTDVSPLDQHRRNGMGTSVAINTRGTDCKLRSTAIHQPEQTRETRFWACKSPRSTASLFEKIEHSKNTKTTPPKTPFSSRTDPPAVNRFQVSAKTRPSRASSTSSYSLRDSPLQQKKGLGAAAIRYTGIPFPPQFLDTSPAKSVSESVASVASVPESIAELRTLWLESDDDSEGEIFLTSEEIRDNEPVANDNRVEGLGICLNPRRSPLLFPEPEYVLEGRLGDPSTPPASPAQYSEADDDAPCIERSLAPLSFPVRYYHISSKLEDPFPLERQSSINSLEAPTDSQRTSKAIDSVAASKPAPLLIPRKPLAACDDRPVQPISPAAAPSGSSTSTGSSGDSAKVSTAVDTGETTPVSITERASAIHNIKEKTHDSNTFSPAIVPETDAYTSRNGEEDFEEEQDSPTSDISPANDFKDQKSNKGYRPPPLLSQKRQAELFQDKTSDHGEVNRHERFPYGGRSTYNSRQWICDSIHRLDSSRPKPKGRRQEIQFGPRLLKSASLGHLRPAPPPKLPILDEDTIHPAHRTGPYFNSADRVILAEVPVAETQNGALPPTPSTPCDPHRKHHRPVKSSSALRGHGTTKLEPTYEVEARLSTWESSPDFGSAESLDGGRQLKTKASPPTLETLGPRLQSFDDRRQLSAKTSSPTLGSPGPCPSPQVHNSSPEISSPDPSCHTPGSHNHTPCFRLHSPVPHPPSPSPRYQSPSPRFQNPRMPPKSPDNARLPATRRPQHQVAKPEVYIPTGAPITAAPALGQRRSLRSVGSTIGQGVKNFFRGGKESEKYSKSGRRV